MRISELSRESGVPVGTIKYYIREGLLPAGERTAQTQAEYGPSHLARLELIRALREGADLSIATLARVFDAMSTGRQAGRPRFLSVAIDALSDPVEIPEGEEDEYVRAGAQVDRLLDEALGWDTDADSPGRADLARALVHIHRYLPGLVEDPAADMIPHAEAMRGLADRAIPDSYDPEADPEGALRYAVLGTALFEPVLLALRKLAHVDRIRAIERLRSRAVTQHGPDVSDQPASREDL